MRIAITGGIGTGKSFVADYLKSKGFVVIDADQIARELMDIGQVNYNNIVNEYGTDILDPKGRIDRKKLASIVFNDENKRKRLNIITHPNIMKSVLKRSEGDSIYFIEISLVFEENLESYFDNIWLLDCTQDTQLKRVLKRDDMNEQEVMARIKCQMPREEKLRKADVIINSEDPDLFKRIDEMLEEIEKQGINEKKL